MIEIGSFKDAGDKLSNRFENSFLGKQVEKVNFHLDDYDAPLAKELSKEMKIETGWSDEIVKAIENRDQYEIYKNAEIYEKEVDGRKCLIRDIDWDYIDEKTGKTNRERVQIGRVPIDFKTGEKIELHHMGQGFDAPFAELTENSEHGDGNHKVLHTKLEDSWRNDEEKYKQYQVEKRQHWKERLEEEEKSFGY